MFLPLSWMRKAVTDDLVVMPPGEEDDLPVLVQDGVSLFDANPSAPSHPLRDAEKGVSLDRVRALRPVPSNYYMYPCSAMFVDTVATSLVHGTLVPEFGFVDANTGSYGCRFQDLVRRSPSIQMVPTCLLTQTEHATLTRCLRWLHPLAPYEAEARNKPALDVFERVTGCRRVVEAPTVFAGSTQSWPHPRDKHPPHHCAFPRVERFVQAASPQGHVRSAPVWPVCMQHLLLRLQLALPASPIRCCGGPQPRAACASTVPPLSGAHAQSCAHRGTTTKGQHQPHHQF